MGEVSMVFDNTQAIRKKLDKSIENGLRMVGATIAGYAADLCPVDTGLLRNSITYALNGKMPAIAEYQNDSGKRAGKNGKPIQPESGHYQGTAPTDTENTVYIGTNVQYAPYQELGAPNANVPPSPFLRPAVESHEREIEEIMTKALKNV